MFCYVRPYFGMPSPILFQTKLFCNNDFATPGFRRENTSLAYFPNAVPLSVKAIDPFESSLRETALLEFPGTFPAQIYYWANPGCR